MMPMLLKVISIMVGNNMVNISEDEASVGRTKLIGFLLLYAVIAVCFLAIFPALRNSLWTGSSEVHAALEIVDTTLSLSVGLSCLIYYFGIRTYFYLIIGCGFFVTGAEDLVETIPLFHCLFTFPNSDSAACSIYAPYVEGRLLLPILIILAPLFENMPRRTKHEKRNVVATTAVAILIGGALNAAWYAVPLPKLFYPENHVITRPLDLLSAMLFAGAFLSTLKRLVIRRDFFSGALLTCIIFNLYSEICLSVSRHIYDALFDAAHWAGIAGGITPLIGIAFQGLDEIRRSTREAEARNKAQQELREALDLLEQKVLERTRELKEAQGHLAMQEKMASVGQLAAGIAHEINNPISFVSTNFGTLQDDITAFKELIVMYRDLLNRLRLEGAIGSEIDKIKAREDEFALDTILGHIDKLFAESRDGLRRVIEIVSSMREFSRTGDSNQFRPFNINKGIRDTLTIARNSYKYHAKVETQLGGIPEIMCIPELVNQVFLNIIVNAAQAIAAQKRDEMGLIFIKTHNDETNVYCEISDDGPGVPDALKNRIFEPFFTTKEPGMGTGLGLSISWDVITSTHGGALSVGNRDGGGASFLIRLPIKSQE